MEVIKDSGHTTSTSRAVFKAMGIFGGTQAFSIICGVVRIKLIAIWLGTAGVGLFAIFNSALTLISGLTQLNVRTSAVRTIASSTPTSPTFPSLLYSIRRLGIWLGILGVLVMLLTAPVFSIRTFASFDHTASFALLAIAVMIMSLTMTEQVILQGLERMQPLARSTITGAVLGLIVTIPLLYFFRTAGVVWVIIVYSVANWIAVRRVRVVSPVPVPTPSMSDIRATSRPILVMGFYLTLAVVTTELCSYIFIAFLNNAGGTSEVGLFQSGYTLVNRYMGMIFSAIGMEFFPRLSTVASSSRRTATFVSHEIYLLTVVLLGVISLFIPLAPVGVRLFYSSEFIGIVPFILLAIPGVVFQGCSWSMAYVLLARGDGRLYMFTEILSALLTITLNILFYRLHGLPGAGLSFTAVNFLYLLIIAFVYHRCYRMPLSPSVILTVCIVLLAVIAMSALALAFNPWWSLPVAVPALLISIRLSRKILNR